MTKERLNRMETYAAGMVIFLGLFYIISLTGTLFQDRNIGSSGLFGFTELKWAVLGAVYISGGILLFLRRNLGWIITVATLLHVVAIAFMYVIAISQWGGFTMFALIPIIIFVLLVMSLIFLFRKETRKKCSVNNKSYLVMIALYMALLVVTYLL